RGRRRGDITRNTRRRSAHAGQVDAAFGTASGENIAVEFLDVAPRPFAEAAGAAILFLDHVQDEPSFAFQAAGRAGDGIVNCHRNPLLFDPRFQALAVSAMYFPRSGTTRSISARLQ